MSALALTDLTLSHFRSHKRLRLEVDARPVALAGPNGIGKTNILEAISFLSPGRGLRRARPEQIALQPDRIGWKVEADFTVDDTSHSVMTASSDGGARTVHLNGKAVSQLALSKLVPMIWLIPAMDRLWTETAEGRRRFLDRLTLNFCVEHGKSVIAYEKAMRDRNRLLKDDVRDPHWYRALEHQMAQTGSEITRNRLRCLHHIRASQANSETTFPIAELTLEGPDEKDVLETPEDIEERLAFGRSRDLAAGRTLNGPHRDDLNAVYLSKGLSARECSTGEQKALLISLILATVRALRSTDGSPPLVLLDEVSAHLDRQRQEALYDEICVLGAQAWMTGTEADLFAPLGSRAQHVTLPLMSA